MAIREIKKRKVNKNKNKRIQNSSFTILLQYKHSQLHKLPPVMSHVVNPCQSLRKKLGSIRYFLFVDWDC